MARSTLWHGLDGQQAGTSAGWVPSLLIPGPAGKGDDPSISGAVPVGDTSAWCRQELVQPPPPRQTVRWLPEPPHTSSKAHYPTAAGPSIGARSGRGPGAVGAGAVQFGADGGGARVLDVRGHQPDHPVAVAIPDRLEQLRVLLDHGRRTMGD